MIVVDTSAIIAILGKEADSAAFADAIISSRAIIGAPTKFELLLVFGRRNGGEGVERASNFLQSLEVEVVPFTDALADAAAQALLCFGKGKHAAKLNYGDCMAYALAKSLDAPLLYKGEDFAKTDIMPAVPTP